MKRVEEKEIERRERAHCAGGDEKKAGVKGAAMLSDFAGEPDRGESHQRGKEQHHQAQTVDAEGKVDVPIGANRKRCDRLVAALVCLEAEIEEHSCAERQA